MTKTSKFFLAISIITFASSFTEAGSNIGWGILRPVGAITFIVFFITNLLAKEVERYEKEERAKRGQAENFGKDSARVAPSPRGIRSSPRLATAATN